MLLKHNTMDIQFQVDITKEVHHSERGKQLVTKHFTKVLSILQIHQ